MTRKDQAIDASLPIPACPWNRSAHVSPRWLFAVGCVCQHESELPNAASHHHTAGESDSDRGPDGELHGRGDGLAHPHGAMAGQHE